MLDILGVFVFAESLPRPVLELTSASLAELVDKLANLQPPPTVDLPRLRKLVAPFQSVPSAGSARKLLVNFEKLVADLSSLQPRHRSLPGRLGSRLCSPSLSHHPRRLLHYDRLFTISRPLRHHCSALSSRFISLSCHPPRPSLTFAPLVSYVSRPHCSAPGES